MKPFMVTFNQKEPKAKAKPNGQEKVRSVSSKRPVSRERDERVPHRQRARSKTESEKKTVKNDNASVEKPRSVNHSKNKNQVAPHPVRRDQRSTSCRRARPNKPPLNLGNRSLSVQPNRPNVSRIE